jgi:two-component system sensor histidine kinase VanS
MKYSLSKRLFIITLSLIIGLMLITYFAQAFFFERFYTNKKTESLVQEVNKFHDLYSLHIDNDADLYKALQKFENDNNAQVIITSLNGEIIRYHSNNFNGDKESFDTLTAFGTELINNKDLINEVITHSQTRYANFDNESSGLKKNWSS